MERQNDILSDDSIDDEDEFDADDEDEDPGELFLTDVPVKFEYEGRVEEVLITPVLGAGGPFHFHVVQGTRYRHLYCGALFLRNDEWAYYGNSFHGLGRFFGEYLMAWYQ